MRFDKINESYSKRKENPRESRAERIIAESNVIDERLTVPIGSVVDYTDEYGAEQPFDIDETKVNALAASMAENGQLEPLIVRGWKEGKYQILAGHHRIRACRKNKFNTVDIKVIECDDWKAFRIVVETNIRHGGPKPSEMSRIIVRYKQNAKEEKLTNKMLADIFDISDRQFYRYINMDKLIPELLKDIDDMMLSTNSVEELIKLSYDQQTVLAEYVDFCKKPLNVAACKKAVSFLLENKNAGFEQLNDFMSKKKVKKKFRNEIFNTLSLDNEISESISKYSENQLETLTTNLLKKYFNSVIVLQRQHIETTKENASSETYKSIDSICSSCINNGDCVPKITDTCIAYEKADEDMKEEN